MHNPFSLRSVRTDHMHLLSASRHTDAETGEIRLLLLNSKGFFSIVLMALVNSNYEFILVDIGAQRAASDGGIWKNCVLYND